jgi:ribonucleoside-diphosphate reductase alpha chain
VKILLVEDDEALRQGLEQLLVRAGYEVTGVGDGDQALGLIAGVEVMVADLKYFDGSLAKIDRVPAEFRELYATAFEVDTKWIIEAGARRQKWIDQAQSLNIYMAGASGKKLDETYKLAWVRGLKTTYYLRTLAATSAEKSTGRGGELNAVSASGAHQGAAAGSLGSVASTKATVADDATVKVCLIDDPTCEACQ